MLECTIVLYVNLPIRPCSASAYPDVSQITKLTEKYHYIGAHIAAKVIANEHLC